MYASEYCVFIPNMIYMLIQSCPTADKATISNNYHNAYEGQFLIIVIVNIKGYLQIVLVVILSLFHCSIIVALKFKKLTLKQRLQR